MSPEDRRPKVVLLSTGLGAGGAERQLVHLAIGLTGLGWNVRVVSILKAQSARLIAELSGAGIPLTYLQRPGVRLTLAEALRLLFSAQAFMREFKPDAVVGWMVHAALLGRLLAMLNATPVMVTSLRTVRSRRRWQDRLLGLTDRLNSAVVTNSSLAARIQVQEGVTRSANSHVIYNGLNMQTLDAERSSPGMVLPRVEGQFRWLAVGRLTVEKDYRLLVKALALLPFGWHLWIVGDGPERADIEGFIAAQGLTDRVTVLGHREDVPALLGQVDAVVMSSAIEGLPNALMEAHAAALPVVATSVGGISEVILHGRTGYLVQSRQPQELAEAMTKMMQTPADQRTVMGQAGRQHVQHQFGLETMVMNWHTLLLRCAGRKN